jgi:hypothetical protein
MRLYGDSVHYNDQKLQLLIIVVDRISIQLNICLHLYRPPFKNPGSMSDELKDFISVCTHMDATRRPTAQELRTVRSKRL